MRSLAILPLFFILLTGCSLQMPKSYGYPDQLIRTKEKNAVLPVICCADGYYGGETWRKFDFAPEYDMADGELAIVRADVTYLDGGIAGCMHLPQIDRLIDMKRTDIETVVEMYHIPDVADTEHFFSGLYACDAFDCYMILTPSDTGYVYNADGLVGTIEAVQDADNVSESIGLLFAESDTTSESHHPIAADTNP